MAVQHCIIPALTQKETVRFWKKIDIRQPNECWLWKAAFAAHGYGKLGIQGKTVRAPRVAYYLHYEIDPGSNCVLHRCDNPPCCNPAHLFLGSKKDNTRDMIKKMRQATGEKHRACTHPESIPRGEEVAISKLTEEDVQEIRRLRFIEKYTQRKLADRFRVSQSNISMITKYRTWRHVP